MTKKTVPPSKAAEQFVVRLPDGMRERIAESAKRHGRSMNAEIVQVLENNYRQQDSADAIEADESESHSFPLPSTQSLDLLEQFKRSLEENTQMRLLMNKQIELMSKLAGEDLQKMVLGDIEYAKESGPRRSARKPPAKPKA